MSEGKLTNIMNDDTGRLRVLFEQGGSLIKAFFVLIICTYTLLSKFGLTGLLPFVFVFAKMLLDYATRRWRDETWQEASVA